MAGGVGVPWHISRQPWGIESIPAGGLGLKRTREELWQPSLRQGWNRLGGTEALPPGSSMMSSVANMMDRLLYLVHASYLTHDSSSTPSNLPVGKASLFTPGIKETEAQGVQVASSQLHS